MPETKPLQENAFFVRPKRNSTSDLRTDNAPLHQSDTSIRSFPDPHYVTHGMPETAPFALGPPPVAQPNRISGDSVRMDDAQTSAPTKTLRPLPKRGLPKLILRLPTPSNGATIVSPPQIRSNSASQEPPSAISSSKLRRFGLHDPIAAQPNPLKSSDQIGTKVANQLPSILINATQKGAVLTVANTLAVIAGLGPGSGRIVVADIDSGHLAGIQSIIKSTNTYESLEDWVAKIKLQHSSIGIQIETFIKRLDGAADFSALKRRADTDGFDFIHADLADLTEFDIATLRSLAPEGYAAIYSSNIEMYLAGFLGIHDVQTGSPKLTQYKSNILNLMGNETQLIRGALGVQMSITNGNAEARNWADNND